MPYCKACPTRVDDKDEALLCAQCKLPLSGEILVLKGAKCNNKLDSRAKEYDGKLYCYSDYQKMMSQTCYSCKRPVEGRSISALGKLYHPDHFACYKCETPFHGAPYFEYESHPYCEVHFKQVTGAVCPYCWHPASGTVINALGHKWCDVHFMCMGCLQNLADEKSEFVEWDMKPFCKKCFDKLPYDIKRHLIRYRDLEKKLVPVN